MKKLISEPIASYRVQLLPHVRRESLAETFDYLSALGVSHAYLSPCFRAASGSTHGYDVVSFSAPLGMLGEDGDRVLGEALTSRGLAAIVDMVPNHMSTRPLENAWWRDVLERGEISPYFGYFDIDLSLDPARKIVLPILPEALERLILQGRIGVGQLGHRVVLRVPGYVLPVSLESADELTLTHLVSMSSDRVALRGFLEQQHYRLIEGRAGNTRVNYRRYLDINELAAVRVEEADVFDATHAQLLGWVRQGWAEGIRVDHPDGLAHPAGYFARLRRSAPGAWILAEKPLRPAEKLPLQWPVDGTTGYDFLTVAMGLFVEPHGLRTLESHWAELTGSEAQCFADLSSEGKRWALCELFQAELVRTAKAARRARGRGDDPRDDVEGALEALVVNLSVGRTQLDLTGPASATDERALRLAAAVVHSAEPEHGPLVAALVELLLKGSSATAEFRQRFQQLSLAAAAKGIEDTAFYRFGALLSLCELGGDPDDAAFSVEDFHAHCLEVLAGRPRTLNTTSTHDTKRGEISP